MNNYNIDPQEKFSATLIRKLIDGQPVESHAHRLQVPWDEVAFAILACPKNPDQRTKAFETAIVDLAEKDLIWDSVFRAPLDGDLPKDEADRFQLHWASEAFGNQIPIEWIIETLLPVGSVSIFFGEPGSKKTYACLDMAVCTALGADFLTFSTKQCPVLFVDEESGVRRMNRRIWQVARGHSANNNLPLAYVSLAQFDLRSSDYIATLDSLIKDVRAGLVIIDTLADVMPGGDENSVKDTQPLMLGLRKLSESNQCAIVVIHHANKAGSYRGSSALKGAVDLLLEVKSKDGDLDILFKTDKVRDVEPMTFSATANFTDDQFWLSSAEYTAIIKSLTRPQEYVIGYLSGNGASLVTDITNHADTCNDKSAKRAVYSLAQDGYVQRVDGGGPGARATYDLTERGCEYARTKDYPTKEERKEEPVPVTCDAP